MSIKFKSTKTELPNAEDLEGVAAKYYLIQPKGFMTCKAMYLKDQNGECGWYLDYTAKIIREVVGWTEI